MIKVKVIEDYNGFAGNNSLILERLKVPKQSENNDTTLDLNIRFINADDDNNKNNRIYLDTIDNQNISPFKCNPTVGIKGVNAIVYYPKIIKKLKLTKEEQYACAFHEIGHIIANEPKVNYDDPLEVYCDDMAFNNGYGYEMLSSICKFASVLDVNNEETDSRINVLSSKIPLFRPKWTCGRYNSDKQVAIMYNLIAGYSYFFESHSANVIGEILKAGRNKDINMTSIADTTGISMESLCNFFTLLMDNGLLTKTKPTASDIEIYRKSISETRAAGESWVDKSTMEKLPMDVSNAEQAYFDTVDDGKTICSCMFELTYRCSEMCIHCYNPGATRNDTEVSHRGDLKELTLDDYKSIIDDMYEHGLVKVCLSGGDPFSKEFVWELLDYLYDKGIAIDVFTNGQRIAGKVKQLADYYPRLVGVSIYSGVAEDHDAITRVPGSWERSMRVVKELHSLAVPMNLKCCVMQPNLHSYYMVADIANEYGAIPQFEINISESNEGDICAKLLRLTEEQLMVVLRDNNLALYVGKEVPFFGGPKIDLSLCSCGAGGTGFCVSPNGDLRACPAFTQVYGNLQTQSIEEILTKSAALNEWRGAVIGDFTECGKYDYCDYCNLCAGLNYTEHDDFRKPAETNCYMAKCRYNLAHQLMEHDEPMTREQLIEALHSLPIKEVVLKRQYRKKG